MIDADAAGAAARALAGQRGRDRPAAGRRGVDPYTHAADTIEAWRMQGVLTADREPALWALTQDYTAPRRHRDEAPRDPRPRPGRGLRRGADPPPRAHPARAQAGPARPHPRDPPQPLPHLLPHHRRRLAARRARHLRRPLGRGHRRRRHRPPRLAHRRPRGPRRGRAGARERRAADRRRPPPL